MNKKFNIVGLGFPSFYLKDYEDAVAFYTKVLGPPKNDVPRINGWKLGETWLTLFPAEDMGTHKDSNPRNTEFAIRVEAPEQVDVLYQAFLDAGAKKCMPPEDTRMYDPMRFCCVDDPFNIRIDIYCPIPEAQVKKP
jgi:uncharacterized glyoxalase superfamily protein PhnB